MFLECHHSERLWEKAVLKKIKCDAYLYAGRRSDSQVARARKQSTAKLEMKLAISKCSVSAVLAVDARGWREKKLVAQR